MATSPFCPSTHQREYKWRGEQTRSPDAAASIHWLTGVCSVNLKGTADNPLRDTFTIGTATTLAVQYNVSLFCISSFQQLLQYI
jgi:hypothetical protein